MHAAQVHKARLLAPSRWVGAPRDGLVAVKVQYPGALEVMVQDLSNIRVCAGFLQAGVLKPCGCPCAQEGPPPDGHGHAVGPLDISNLRVS